MKFLSICSGIEAASVAWNPLGWEAVGFSEIEPFPCAVLKHHFPNVKNYGDMTRYESWNIAPGTVDLVCGGTPCQSFSVAGKRGGLDDARGNLMLVYLKILASVRPRFFVWENVPGVLSSNGGNDFRLFLDTLEEIGYIVDVDILDAQFHGVPQRRRRVFVCGQSVETLLQSKTDSSALTITQCIAEILHGILIDHLSRCGSGHVPSGSASLSKDGVSRRMKLFGLHGENNNWKMLLENLEDARLRCQNGQGKLDAVRGEKEAVATQGGPSTDLKTELPFLPTAESLKIALEEAYAVMKSFITSTATRTTTQREIYSCSIAVLLISKLTCQLDASSPCFFSAASSNLTALRGYISYAGSTSSDLFGDVERVSAWRDFIREAVPVCEFIGGIGVENFGEILSVSEGLQGHHPPSRKARQGVAPSIIKGAAIGRKPENGPQYGEHLADGSCYTLNATEQHAVVAPTISARTKGGGGLGTDFDLDGGLVECRVAPTLPGSGAVTGRTGNERTEAEFLITHSLRGEGHDASEDGTGRETPLVVAPTNTQIATRHVAMGRGTGFGVGEPGDPAYTLQHGHHHAVAIRTANTGANGHGIADGVSHTLDGANGQCVAVGWNGDITPKTGIDVCPTLRREQGGEGVGVGVGSTVRRLTPRECERLQGFPDDWTLIPWRGKPAEDCPDGPRYKAIGNSWAVPCARWIGERIEMVEKIL